MHPRYWSGLSAACVAPCGLDQKAGLIVSWFLLILDESIHLFFYLKRYWVHSCNMCIVHLPPLSRVCPSQLLRPLHLLRDVTAHRFNLGFAQAVQLTVEVLHGWVLAVASGEYVGELAQCHEVAQWCRCEEEVAEQLGFLRRHDCGGRLRRGILKVGLRDWRASDDERVVETSVGLSVLGEARQRVLVCA